MSAPSAWSLFRSEPYRLLFPLAWLWGVAATWHWVALKAGWVQSYAPLRHGYLQALGFGGGIAAGFLLTSLPFFLAAPPAVTWELILAIALVTGLGASAWADHLPAALLTFFLLNALLVQFILRRFNPRQGAPPPLAYIAWGLIHGLLGSALALLAPAACPTLGNRILAQGFLLSLILGIGSFLGARFLGTFQPPALLFRLRLGPPAPPPILIQRVFLLGGLLLFASFLIEALLAAWLGNLLRLAVVAFQFFAFARIHRVPPTRSWCARALWLSYWMILLGLLLALLLPRHEIAALHITYIGGFGLMMLVMGLRVLTSHGGLDDWWDATRALPALLVAGALLAVLLRLSASLFPAHYLPLLAAGSIAWLIVLLTWGLLLLPRVLPRYQPRPPLAQR